jgi:hypothetical protein
MNSATALMTSRNTEGQYFDFGNTGKDLTMNSVTTLLTSRNTEGQYFDFGNTGKDTQHTTKLNKIWKTKGTVRVFGRHLHSRMPLDPTHVRLKRTRV